MANMGRYCKAYYAQQLSAFPGWEPNLQQLRPAMEDGDDAEAQTVRTELRDDDILYVQENLAVTDGIFLDQHVVFEAGAPGWEEFCRGTLGFEIPADLSDDTLPSVPPAAQADAPPIAQTT